MIQSTYIYFTEDVSFDSVTATALLIHIHVETLRWHQRISQIFSFIRIRVSAFSTLNRNCTPCPGAGVNQTAYLTVTVLDPGGPYQQTFTVVFQQSETEEPCGMIYQLSVRICAYVYRVLECIVIHAASPLSRRVSRKIQPPSPQTER